MEMTKTGSDLPVVSREQSELGIHVELFALGWNVALARGESGIEVSSAALLEQPRIFAVRFGKPRIKTSGYAFPAAGEAARYWQYFDVHGAL